MRYATMNKALFLLIPIVSFGCGCGAKGAATSNSCSLPDCLARLVSGFEPVAPCTYQSTIQGGIATAAICYANGSTSVFTSSTTPPAAGQTSTTKQTYWKAGALLFSVETTTVNDGSSPVSSIFRDSTGEEVASSTIGVGSSKATVTCTGGAPTTMDAACWLAKIVGPVDDTGMGTQNCTQGTCAP